MFSKNKWKLYLFYNGILIKRLTINNLTQEDLKTRFIRVYGHKKLFGKWIVGIMVDPVKLLKTDEKNKKTYWGVVFERGVDY